MQRRETFGAKELQTAEVKNQSAATHRIHECIIGEGACVDPSMSPYTLTMAAADVIHRVSNRTADAS